MVKKNISLLMVASITLLLAFLAAYFYTNLTKVSAELDTKEKEFEELNKSYAERLAEYQNYVSSLKPGEEKIPTSKELLTFLELDNTNELKYDNASFDCTGFAFELYKRARAVGYKVGIVELEFEKEVKGHMFNAFQTSDKGVVYIDVTGNPNQTGLDKIAFIDKGKEFKEVIIPKSDELVVCNFECSDLVNIRLTKKKFDLFSEEFLTNVEACDAVYNDCVEKFNSAVEAYNKGEKKYTYEQLKQWQDNLKMLSSDFSVNGFFILVKGDKIKNIQTYW
ncbi:MAG: hypothetical protein ACP5IJ_00390 [Candidatus Nanoarchaeia archaeon]